MKIAIICAMPEEISLIKAKMSVDKEYDIAKRRYYEGRLYGIDTILVLSRIGKVSAAITTTILLKLFKVNAVIITGMAGAVDEKLNIGDVVIADNLIQHDIDASPFFPKHEVPLLGVSVFKSNLKLIDDMKKAISGFFSKILKEIDPNTLKAFNIINPKFSVGTTATGDQFVNDPIIIENIKKSILNLKLISKISNLKCIEMEGAAVAQACYEFNVPFLVIRFISDKADHSAVVDFNKFSSEIACQYSNGIIKSFYELKISYM